MKLEEIIPVVLFALLAVNFIPAAVVAWRRPRVFLFFAIVLGQIAIGTTFYHFQEAWSWIDAAYFSVITLATVGFGDLTPTTPQAKLFTIFYLISGVGIAASFMAFIARQNPAIRPFLHQGDLKFTQATMHAHEVQNAADDRSVLGGNEDE